MNKATNCSLIKAVETDIIVSNTTIGLIKDIIERNNKTLNRMCLIMIKSNINEEKMLQNLDLV